MCKYKNKKKNETTGLKTISIRYISVMLRRTQKEDPPMALLTANLRIVWSKEWDV